MFDLSTPFGKRAVQRLTDDLVVWIVTVRRDGTPQPSPVWFFWNGESILIYSQPGVQKLRNLARNPLCSLHFNGDGSGGDIVILEGEAHRIETVPAEEAAHYFSKYGWGFDRIGMTSAEFARTYSVPLRFTPRRLRGH
jgi:PPOX class probable F420-dependent enzyme